MSYNKRLHLRQNIDAIKLAFRLDRENRNANPEERKVLTKYSGFGGIKTILNPIGKPEDIQQWPKSEVELFPLVQELHEVLRENSQSPETYKYYVSSLKNSILTAFYTPKPVINALFETLQSGGINPETFLEPSAGTGAFITSCKTAMPNVKVTGIEKDLLSGKILSHLHPDDTIRVEGYENIASKYKGHFDMIASNIPFGDVAVFDPELSNHDNPALKQSTKTIHNYFFAKSVQMVREGGIIAFITSQGVLNSEKNKPIREYLMNNCDIVSVCRLPNNLFTEEAGTEVGTDLIILQRKTGISELSQHQKDFIASRKLSNGISINNLFRDFERVVQTASKIDTDPYGKPAIVFTHEGGMEGIAKDLQILLKEDFSQYLDVKAWKTHFPRTLFNTDAAGRKEEQGKKADKAHPSVTQQPLLTLYDLFDIPEKERKQVKRSGRRRSKRQVKQRQQPIKKEEPETPFLDWREELTLKRLEKEKKEKQKKQQQEAKKQMLPAPFKPDDIKPHHHDGSLVSDENNRIGYLRGINELQPMFHPLELNSAQKMKASLYIELRDTYHHLYSNEATRLKANPALREMLNRLYEDFTNRFGNINDAKNLSLIKMDAGGTEVLALERYINGEAVKADIFKQPVAFNPNEVSSVKNAQEALAASLNKYGEVNSVYMAKLVGNTPEEILEELKGQVFFNPLKGEYEIKDKFISGNVLSKAEQIETFLGNNPGHEEARESLAALQEAIPRPILFDELDFNFGERWIPTTLYSKYASHLFDTDVAIHYIRSRDEYGLKAENKNVKITDQYAIKSQSRSFDGIALMKHALHNTSPDITKKVMANGEEVKVRDMEAIQLANSKIDEIRNGFNDWLTEQSKEFKERLTDKYNLTFNCFVRPDYDGSHQEFPQLDLRGLGIDGLYKSQKDAIWMDKINGGGIIDHEVGGGKTLIMCISAYEKKRLGLINKPLIIALKANVHEIARTFCTAYPHARVLYPGKQDFTPSKRLRIFNDMKNNNWDAIILTHEQFGMIPQSPEVQQQILQAELDSVEENLEVVRSQGVEVSRAMQKGLIKRQQNLEAKLKNISWQIDNRKDNTVDFKLMGIDHLYVDESHYPYINKIQTLVCNRLINRCKICNWFWFYFLFVSLLLT
ncbi:MAG: N-6 DNA methylase [Draconibacterium sp.]